MATGWCGYLAVLPLGFSSLASCVQSVCCQPDSHCSRGIRVSMLYLAAQVHTPYDLSFRVERDHTVLCTRELTQKELQQFRKVGAVGASAAFHHGSFCTHGMYTQRHAVPASRILLHHQAAT
jgi:hypothetical protein